jgi:hypothetical protein
MGIRIPKNQTVESKYTSGKEYMFVSTQNEYKGYYYEMNGKIFAGEKFKPGDPEIIKIKSDKYNMLLGNAATYLYGLVSKVKLNQTKISSLPLSNLPSTDDFSNGLSENQGINSRVYSAVASSTLDVALQFYCKKVNSNIIKSIDENTYKSLQKDPLYKTTFVGIYNGTNQTPDDAEQQVPGIKIFLGL